MAAVQIECGQQENLETAEINREQFEPLYTWGDIIYIRNVFSKVLCILKIGKLF
jgi:hypothetical protein